MEPNTGISNDKGMAYVAYIIFFIPLLMGKRSDFLNYHTNQGTVLFLFAFVLQIVLSFFIIIPILGLILQLARILPLIFLIMGLMNVSRGEMKPLPFIGGITLVK